MFSFFVPKHRNKDVIKHQIKTHYKNSPTAIKQFLQSRTNEEIHATLGYLKQRLAKNIDYFKHAQKELLKHVNCANPHAILYDIADNIFPFEKFLLISLETEIIVIKAINYKCRREEHDLLVQFFELVKNVHLQRKELIRQSSSRCLGFI